MEADAADPMSKDMKGMLEGRGGWNGAVGTRRCWRFPGGLPPLTPPPGTAGDACPPLEEVENTTGGIGNSLGIGLAFVKRERGCNVEDRKSVV